MTGVPPPLSARDRLEEALARIADANGEGSRACQRHTTGLALPDWRMISAVPQPSAVARMIWAHHTCFCGAQRSTTIASSRWRSTGVTLTTIPALMRRACTASGDLGIARMNQTTRWEP